MYIIAAEQNLSLDDILLILEPSEARELAASLNSLFKSEIGEVHHHINDASYQKEITICLCKNGDITSFHPKIRHLIEEETNKECPGE